MSPRRRAWWRRAAENTSESQPRFEFEVLVPYLLRSESLRRSAARGHYAERQQRGSGAQTGPSTGSEAPAVRADGGRTTARYCRPPSALKMGLLPARDVIDDRL